MSFIYAKIIEVFFTDNRRRNLVQKGSFTEKYGRNLDQKVFLNVKGSFTGQYFSVKEPLTRKRTFNE